MQYFNECTDPILSASVSCMDMGNFKKQIQEVESAVISLFHYDVVDGIFNQCLILGDLLFQYLQNHTSLPIEVHLAVQNPEPYIKIFGSLKANFIAVHREVLVNPEETFELIRSYGARPILAFRQETPPDESFIKLARQCDGILKLTVNPGFSGQILNPESLKHIAAMRHLLDINNLSLPIQADGNINPKTINCLRKAGALIFTGGTSGLFVPGNTLSDNISKLSEPLQQPFKRYYL